jgi:hypothetical protein
MWCGEMPFANFQNGDIQGKENKDGDCKAEALFKAIVETVGLDNAPADTIAVTGRLERMKGWSGQWTRNMDRKLAQYAAKLDPKALARNHRVSADQKLDFQRVVTQLMAVREAFAKDGKVADGTDVDLTRVDAIRREVMNADAAMAAQVRSHKQSEAAKKGWETRRANEAASAPSADAGKTEHAEVAKTSETAKKSEASKKGWETRRANEAAAKRAAEATTAAATAEAARRMAETKRAADEAAAATAEAARRAAETKRAADEAAAAQRAATLQQQAAETIRQQQAADAAAAARRAEDEHRRRSEAATRGWETRRANEAAAAAPAASAYAYTPPSASYYESSGSANGRELHVGPRGGTYYNTDSGNKRYV